MKVWIELPVWLWVIVLAALVWALATGHLVVTVR